ncbi:MAG: hypothetical protein LBF61_02780 [Azoarcus sp.]|jgi:hypothetical protein|nr:hypothetical protein [Azoarcus sp.]
MSVEIRLKRGTAAQIAQAAAQGKIVQGEPVYLTDTRALVVGDSDNAYTTFPPPTPATEIASGIVQLATPAEVVAGTDATKAATPAAVAAAIAPLVIHEETTEAAAQAASADDPDGWYAAPIWS